MSDKGTRGFKLSLDVWAVAIAFLLVILVRTGILQRVPW